MARRKNYVRLSFPFDVQIQQEVDMTKMKNHFRFYNITEVEAVEAIAELATFLTRWRTQSTKESCEAADIGG